MIKVLNNLAQPNVVDLTSASTDYMLDVGETATITYTSATSVPLHVATVQGVYEIELVQPITDISFSSAKGCDLLPNNTSIAAGSIIRLQERIDGTTLGVSENSSSYTVMHFGSYNPFFVKAVISTFTESKVAKSECHGRESVNSFQVWKVSHIWNDSTTKWTSLGTIDLNIAQSGKIIIRRII